MKVDVEDGTLTTSEIAVRRIDATGTERKDADIAVCSRRRGLAVEEGPVQLYGLAVGPAGGASDGKMLRGIPKQYDTGYVGTVLVGTSYRRRLAVEVLQ